MQIFMYFVILLWIVDVINEFVKIYLVVSLWHPIALNRPLQCILVFKRYLYFRHTQHCTGAMCHYATTTACSRLREQLDLEQFLLSAHHVACQEYYGIDDVLCRTPEIQALTIGDFVLNTLLPHTVDCRMYHGMFLETFNNFAKLSNIILLCYN